MTSPSKRKGDRERAIRGTAVWQMTNLHAEAWALMEESARALGFTSFANRCWRKEQAAKDELKRLETHG